MKLNKIAGSLALIAGLAAASSVAQANTTYNVGTLVPGYTTNFGINWTPAPFIDTFNFHLNAASDVSASLNDFPVSLYSLSIYKDANLFLSLNGGAPIADGQSTTIYNLGIGNYSAVVSGNATGLSGGIYAVSMSAKPAAVPVPAAVWLLGSGLLGLAGVARRKEQA